MNLTSVARRPASSGNADSLVIFLHGYGANGADLISLATVIETQLPNAAFASPDAPQECAGVPGGYQWFPLTHDESEMMAAQVAFFQAIDGLNSFIDEEAKRCWVSADRVVLFGFSQGTMMALHLAAARRRAVAGIVGFSGRLITEELIQDVSGDTPPILLVHGDRDEIIPYSNLESTEKALKAAGFSVHSHVSRDCGHGIAPDGLGAAIGFMKDKIG